MAVPDDNVSAQGQDAKKVPLNVDKDRLSAGTLNLKDEHVSASLGLFVIHNVLRRNLVACADNAGSVVESNVDAFGTYANYTVFVLEDQLDAVDTIWYPVFAKYDERFHHQIAAHETLRARISELKLLLPSKDKIAKSESLQTEQISAAFRQLYDLANQEFDKEEMMSNDLGHQVPIDEIRRLEKQQEARRVATVKIYGHLWSAVYLLRSLSPKEKAIFPPGLPKVIASSMMTAGALQFRRELQWAPKL